MEREIGRLQGHYIICGAGRVGRAVARQLESNPAPFILLDRQRGQGGANPRRKQVGWSSMPTLPWKRNCSPRELTKPLDLVAATTTDATNTYVVLTARSLNPA